MELIECIERIPSLLNKLIDSEEANEQKLTEYFGNRKIDEIVFIASGTSYNSANVTKYYAENNLGLKVRCIYPNEFVNYRTYKNSSCLYVVISQGGITKLVYEALEIIKQWNYLNCSITEDLDSPIAKLADISLSMGSNNEEFMYRTIGYSTTVCNCFMLELILAKRNMTISAKKYQDELNDLRNASSNIKTIINISNTWYEDNKFSLLKRSKCILSGANYLYEVANEADIKLMEMVPMMTRSFELEELIHGPQNSFDDSTIFFILADRNFDIDKVRAIKNFIRNEIGYCAIVGDYQIDDRDLKIEYKSINFRPLELITCFQVISYHMATDKGRDLTRGVNANIQKYIKKTM